METVLKYHALSIFYKGTAKQNKYRYTFFPPCNFTFFLKTDLKYISFLMSIYFTQRPSVKIHLAI